MSAPTERERVIPELRKYRFVWIDKQRRTKYQRYRSLSGAMARLKREKKGEVWDSSKPNLLAWWHDGRIANWKTWPPKPKVKRLAAIRSLKGEK